MSSTPLDVTLHHGVGAKSKGGAEAGKLFILLAPPLVVFLTHTIPPTFWLSFGSSHTPRLLFLKYERSPSRIRAESEQEYEIRE